MSDFAADRLSRWLEHGTGQWGRGVASDVLALEARVAALEGNRHATPDSSPAGDGEWRMLEVGEEIEEGDEVIGFGQVGRLQMTGPMGFRVARDEAGKYRRRVKPATPAGEKDLLIEARAIDTLRHANNVLRDENARLKKDVDWWREEYNKELATREQRFADLRRKSDAANAKCERLEAENTALREQAEGRQAMFDNLRAENERLKKESDGWKETHRHELAKRAALIDRCTELRGGRDAANTECDRLRAENERLRQRLAAPIDVGSVMPGFDQWWFRRPAHLGQGKAAALDAVLWLAARLNAAARKEVGE